MGIFSAFITSSLLMAQGYECLPPSQSAAPVLEKGHVHSVRTAEEAREQFLRIYSDSRRLKNRVYWSEQNQQYSIPEFFITNLKSHLLQALGNTYADFLYYADLGHLHLLIPEAQEGLSLESEDLLSLFHTGELYRFKSRGRLFGPLTEDPHWQWLYWHRNFVGKNQVGESLLAVQAPANAFYNTVRSIDGYKEVGTVYFSANKNGCFQLKNDSVDLRFDISVTL